MVRLMPTPFVVLSVNNLSILILFRVGLQLKLIYQRVCKIFIGKENKPVLDGKIKYFSVQRTDDHLLISLKENLHILCSPSRAYYRADFHVFGLKMTVEEWSMILPRKNWGFQNASLRKMHLKVLSRKQCVITGFPVLT